MKFYVSALLLTIGVVLHFGVSSSMPASSSNQPTSQPRNPWADMPRFRDQPVFNDETGELVAIIYNQKRIKISDMVFEEKDPNLIPNQYWLWRIGPGFHGIFHDHKIYYARDFSRTGIRIEPRKNDLVVEPLGSKIEGIFRDDGHYYEIVYRKTRAHKWTLP